jgi:hypothetical protein
MWGWMRSGRLGCCWSGFDFFLIFFCRRGCVFFRPGLTGQDSELWLCVGYGVFGLLTGLVFVGSVYGAGG